LQYKNRKNLYKILFIAILLGFTISLVGCDWLSSGLLNIFDPQAQIRINYTNIDLTEDEGTIALEVYSLNEVEFIGTGFEYDYYNGTTKISSLSKIVGATFYVEPSTSPGTPGPTTTIDLPLYYQEVQDYVTSNPLITEITCTISLIGTDGAGHKITKSVTFDLPALQPGIDFEPPVAYFDAITTETDPLTFIFDASGSTDDRGIESYSWDFGDGTSGTGVLVTHTYSDVGTYIVTLTVTDFFDNEGYYIESITINESLAEVVVSANPSTVSPGGSSTIIANCTDDSGNAVPNGTYVGFGTVGGGTLTVNAGGLTINGIATANLKIDIASTVTVVATTIYAAGSVDVICAE